MVGFDTGMANSDCLGAELSWEGTELGVPPMIGGVVSLVSVVAARSISFKTLSPSPATTLALQKTSPNFLNISQLR